MTYFINTRFSVLDDTEMNAWLDSNPIPNELVMHTGGIMFYFDEDLALQQLNTGKTQVYNENVDTYASTDWNSPLLRCEIVGLFIDGVVQRQIPSGAPGVNEFTYDFTTGQFELNAALSGEWVMVQYVQSWEYIYI